MRGYDQPLKNHRKKFVGIALIAMSLISLLFYGFAPRYVQRALVYLYPGIDDIYLFPTRRIAAGISQDWPVSPQAPFTCIPDKYLPDFEKYKTVAFVVIQDSTLLFEQYWDDYADSSFSNTFSMSKSVVSLLTGCALADGYLQSLDEPICKYIPEYPQNNEFTPLTIRHLLTMSGGIDYDESYSSLFSKTTEVYYGDDLFTSAVHMPQVSEPGTLFKYQSGATLLLSIALQRAVGKPLSDYFSEKIWVPIGAEHDAYWSLDHENGIEKAYCCIYSNARDYARLGQLLLNRGAWGDNQLIPEDYIEEMTMPDATLTQWFDGKPNQVYGYQLWITSFRGHTVWVMQGILGQYIMAIPDFNAVIVRLGKANEKEYTSDHFHKDILVWLGAGFEIVDTTSNEQIVTAGSRK